ncbi:MAG: hypothetical protein AAB517_00355 [Patescibacteria group bacterium]
MRTLNDIIPPSRRKEMDSIINTNNQEPANFSPERPPRFPYVTLGIVALVIALSIGALFYFSTARVDVTPSTVSAEIQVSFTASKGGGDLPFEVITAQKIATQSVKGSGTKTVNSSASGIITIYNTQAKSQRLIEKTRFATASGLVFRIRSAVTVPGGSSSKPGSVNAKVYADKDGASYNIGPSSFTIPGFAGAPQESQVYARSSGMMTGGASGTVPVVDTALETQTRSSLASALAPDLLASLKEQIPSGYLLIPGSATTTYEEVVPATSSTDGMVELKEQGTITAVVFQNSALAKKIAGSIAGLNYQGELSLSGVDNLLFASANMPNSGTSSFSFTLAGTASLVYVVDPSRITSAIAGKTRSEAKTALDNYPEIKQAVIILRPFWRQAFPQDPASIEVAVDGL